jgi:membrane protein implicated in regulation of membrane protease activity
MEPRDIRPAVRIHDGDTVPFDTVEAAMERRRDAAAAAVAASAPPKLAKMLLPGEHIRFGTQVHPVVMVLPALCLLAVAVLSGWLTWFGTQHHGAWLHTGAWPIARQVVELSAAAAALGLLVKRWFRFLGLRVVATNRRIFAIRGVIVRRITPLGNSALAGSTLSQGLFGRMFGYGSIDLPLAHGTPDAFRDMRDALQLYREFQAVANGVDGDEWKPAVRQTIIP